MKTLLRASAQAVGQALVPSLCPACRHHAGPGLCSSCLVATPPVPNPCVWCGTPKSNPGAACHHCADKGLPYLSYVCAPRPYAGVFSTLVRRAKVSQSLSSARALSAVVIDDLVDLGFEPEPGTVVTTIPANRHRRNGPHLPRILAEALCAHWGLPFKPLLKLNRLAPVQHDLPLAQRAQAVDGLYVGDASPCPGQVILVDDVLTSGATLRSAARTLRHAGCRQVIGLCACRTPHGRDPKPSETTEQHHP